MVNEESVILAQTFPIIDKNNNSIFHLFLPIFTSFFPFVTVDLDNRPNVVHMLHCLLIQFKSSMDLSSNLTTLKHIYERVCNACNQFKPLENALRSLCRSCSVFRIQNLVRHSAINYVNILVEQKIRSIERSSYFAYWTLDTNECSWSTDLLPQIRCVFIAIQKT